MVEWTCECRVLSILLIRFDGFNHPAIIINYDFQFYWLDSGSVAKRKLRAIRLSILLIRFKEGLRVGEWAGRSFQFYWLDSGVGVGLVPPPGLGLSILLIRFAPLFLAIHSRMALFQFYWLDSMTTFMAVGPVVCTFQFYWLDSWDPGPTSTPVSYNLSILLIRFSMYIETRNFLLLHLSILLIRFALFAPRSKLREFLSILLIRFPIWLYVALAHRYILSILLIRFPGTLRSIPDCFTFFQFYWLDSSSCLPHSGCLWPCFQFYWLDSSPDKIFFRIRALPFNSID